MTIQLLGFEGSGYVTMVVATLNELGLPYEFVKFTKYEDSKTPEFLAKNPLGKVPVLIDGDFTIYESRAIARYLANKYQGTKTSTVLIPSDAQKAALVDQFISVEATSYSVPLNKLIGQEVYSKFRGGSPDPEIIKESLEELNKVLDVYEKLLEGKEYIAGEFSLADIFHYPGTRYAVSTERKFWNDPKRPNVARWWKNLSEREAWKKTLTEMPVPKK